MTNDQPDYTSVVARPQTQLAGSPWAFGTGGHTKTFALTPDTSIASVLITNPQNVSTLTIAGHTSGIVYLTIDPALYPFTSYYQAVISSAVDGSVDVSITASVAGTAYVSSIPDPVAQVPLFGIPAPWQAANQPPATIDFGNPGLNGVKVVIPAPAAGQSIYLHAWSYTFTAVNANMFGVWQDSSGAELVADSAGGSVVPRFMDFHGAKLNSNLAFQFKQTGGLAANTIFCNGVVTYSVY